MKEQLKRKYDDFEKKLSSFLFKVDAKNADIRNLQYWVKTLIDGFLQETKNEAYNALNGTEWDKLVVAFFGETNAGKSTIVETFRILLGEKSRNEEMDEKKQNVDGLIIGDGRSDFTQTYKEYDLLINNYPFTLIDVPGIEGNEEIYKKGIEKALSKAHCVFYVQGHNKAPDTKTVEKIKRYLSEWVNVYSIYNVRGACSDYDEEEERELLMTNKRLEVQSEITNTFRSALGDLYKGNISIQALLALCSKANFAPSRTELQNWQDKLERYFGSKEKVYEFSGFDAMIKLLTEKAKNFESEITEANKQKLIALSRRVSRDLEKQTEELKNKFEKLNDQLGSFLKDCIKIFCETKSTIEKDIDKKNDELFNKFRTQLYEIIDGNYDEAKKKIRETEQEFGENFQKEFPKVIKKNISKMNEKLLKKRKSLDAFRDVTFASQYDNVKICTLDADVILEQMDISFEDIFDLVGNIMGGAAVGSLFPGIGNVVGAFAGALLFLLRKLIFDDCGQGKAKAKVKEEIENAKCKTFWRLKGKVIKSVNKELDSTLEKIKEKISEEQMRLGELERLLKNIQKNIKEFTNEINKSEYGKI